MSLPLTQARKLADKVVEELLPACERVEIAGSIRRERPECGDIDLVLLPHARTGEVLLPDLVKRLIYPDGKLETDGRAAKRLRLRKNGVQCDLWIAHHGMHVGADMFSSGYLVPPNFGALMATYTGSMSHNINRLITAAKRQGWKWSPVQGIVIPGPTDGASPVEIVSEDEAEIFRRLFGSWITPNKRET